MNARPPHKILLLNANYIPISIIDIQRACILIWTEKAVVVDTYRDISLRSASKVFEYPSIIALKYYVPVKFEKVSLDRRNLYKRDGYKCVYCKASPKKDPSVKLTMDHVVPRALGGKTVWHNIATACKSCNTKKGDKPLDLLDSNRFPIPKTFKPNFLMLTSGMRNIPESWKPYLMHD